MLAVAAIYFGKPVLVPLTLAILLTFLLNPVVNLVERTGLPRAAAVLVVVISVFSLLGIVAYAMGRQVTMLAAELPQYKDNIIRKISDFRTAGHSGALERFTRTFHDIVGEIERQDGPTEQKGIDASRRELVKKAEEHPVPVVVKHDGAQGTLLPLALGSVMEWLVTAGLVIVLVVFMLLRLQDLRNRLIRVVGYSRLTSTTRALDDAGDRISRYLLMQSIINATYGFSVGVGLFFIGLPYVVLLGFIAGTMRFIPYVGPPLGAALPLALSLALTNGWMSTLEVVALFGSLELVTGMVLEPRLYGQSAGVSEVALLVAIAFWTWVWGAVGLALATPLTVCLVVLCKYIPELEFVQALVGDEPVVDSPIVYYQRLLARDTDEAAEIVQGFVKEHPPEQIYDGLLLPALHWVKRDALRDKLAPEDVRFIVQTTRVLLDGIEAPAPEQDPSAPAPAAIRIVGCPARDTLDELGLYMLARLLDSRRFVTEVLSSEKLVSETIAFIREHERTSSAWRH